MLARNVGDCGHNNYLGTVADLENNWRRLLDAAGLTAAEYQEAESAYHRVLAGRILNKDLPLPSSHA